MMKEQTQNEPRLVAVCVADLHLSSKPPAARSVEADWLRVQASYLDQLRRLAVSPTGEQRVPVIIPGDFFDKATAGPEVINLALAHLPHCHGVWGNHDLPNHDPKQLRRSAFWTLVKAGKVTMLSPDAPVEVQGGGTVLRLHGFPFGSTVTPLREPHDLALEVAVVHAYIWTKATGYAGAPSDQHRNRWLNRLTGYDAAFFGDNHKSFTFTPKKGAGPTLCNLGGFMRRKIDEMDHRPSAGLLYSDGSVKRHYFDVSQDQFINGDKLRKVTSGDSFSVFLESLAELGDAAIDFAERVRRALDQEKVDPEVRRLILGILDDAAG